ncbi:hypothetical protein K493DRAFT_301270 [Basidiobolus meristosporus CBS 931.73]|uniref:Peptidase C51 domain-containing protein n=1 Tax=Basidiobolus meristosporus CBS 931.73 TaxID=1314790 RepID=A0A1Y1YCJ0_9FUNG|nr:hypothetical protein K493DRAFT_301270 [Basidiobolus meristosporus CBS 931.73]|eukprot:ORX95740.1 hypothetical protein K493DRAFT_301270 [Basidiobolus meristosporus CBS 931.73]
MYKFAVLYFLIAVALVRALPVSISDAGSQIQQEEPKLAPRYYSYKNSWGYNPQNSNQNYKPSYNKNSRKGNRNSKQNNSYGGNGNDSSDNDNGYTTQPNGPLEFRFKNGQCTDWADARYAQLTGHHIEWWGDARVWASKAQSTPGWSVSGTPKQPSIIVIQPGVQGTGSPGHVAVVERIEANGNVYTSNYNYNGGPYIKKYATFKPGNGVSFIWHN